MRAVLIIALTLTVACSSIRTFPYQARMFDEGRRHWRAGRVIAERADGAQLFQFDDSTEGDHGFMWVAEGDPAHLIVKGPAPSLFDATSSTPGGIRP
jgi:hypothetical protein